jgi:hypothetical protein
MLEHLSTELLQEALVMMNDLVKRFPAVQRGIDLVVEELSERRIATEA